MNRKGLLGVTAVALALNSGLGLAQDLNVSITLENASQSRAAAADLALPIEQEQPPSPAPPEEERRFEPADFARPNRLESIEIAASDLPRGTTTISVRCQAFIAPDGKLGEFHCSADDSAGAALALGYRGAEANERVVAAVMDTVPMQQFVGARVDGESVGVVMNFAVYVDCSSGSCLAVAARNHGYHIERLGLDYVDPQPIVDGENWYDGFDYKLRSARERSYTRGAPDKVPYVMAVEVDASGVAGPGCLVWAVPARPVPGMGGLGRRVAPMQTPRTKLYLEKAIGSLGNVRYVPGTIDGRAATLTLYEESVTQFDQRGTSEALLSLGDIECKNAEPEPRFEPADFAEPNHLESIRIAPSDLPRGTTGVAVRCQAFIARDGTLGEYHCIPDDNRIYERVVKAVTDAVPAQRFVPARVDGESVRVLMNFGVYVDCSSGSCVAVAARNHGYDIERLGLDYVDPQPILEGNDWYEGFDYKLISARDSRYSRYPRGAPGDKVPYVMAAEVDASGLAGPGCLVWANSVWPVPGTPGPGRRFPFVQTPRTKLYLEQAIASLGNVRYVPGMIDGKAATLTLYEQSVTRRDLGATPEALVSLADIGCETAEQERRFEPADFAEPNRLESIAIAASDLPRGTTAVAVRCQAFIGTDGGLGDHQCVSDDNIAAEDVIHAVMDAVPTQRFVAARVDGENVRVLMNFAVYVDCSSGSCVAVAARNHGYHIGRLGIDYVDPQPILAGDDWYDGFDYKLRWIRESQRSRILRGEFVDAFQYVMAAEVDASGVAGPGCLYWVGVASGSRNAADPRNSASARPIGNTGERAMAAPLLPPRAIESIERAIASLGGVSYVPGMVNGEPTALRLYEDTLARFQESTLRVTYSVGDIDCEPASPQ